MPGTSKEYELLFLLKAQVDSSMRQFSVVGGQLKELEEKIQGYNNTLKTIDGYRQQETAISQLEQKMRELEAGTDGVNQKFNEATAATRAARAEVEAHQAAIDALNMKKAEQRYLTKEQRIALEQEKQALKESRAALKETEAAEKEAANAKNGHQKSIDDLRVKIATERQRLLELSEALKKAGVDTRDLEAAEKLLREQTAGLTREQEKWAAFGNTINTLANEFSALRMAGDGAMSVIRPILGFYGESLEAAARLEYSMSAVKAISGATADEEKRMTAVVKEMGATTIYTATEAAGAMEKMALAGWETEQMIAGLPAVVKLAAAAGEELEEMTSIVADGMNAFHLQGEQAAVKFADVLAKTATSSNTTVALLGQSLSYAETTAGNLGYSIEDVSLALAAMANNALKGGAAGTALNTMLTRMSGANETAANEMDRLGLSMYDNNGVAKDLLTFLNELRGAFDGFGDDAQEAQIAAYKLAGMRGMRGLMAIVNQTDEQWEKLTADVYAYAGAADQISDVRLDNYTGKVQLLKDAWDALQTSVGEAFLPKATQGVEVLKDLTDRANEFVKDHPAVVEGFGAMALSAGGAFTAITAISGALQGLRYAMNILKQGELMTVLGGFTGVGLASLAIGAGVTLWSSWDQQQRIIENARKSQEKSVREYTQAIEAAKEAGTGPSGALDDLQSQLRAAEAELENARAAYDEARAAPGEDKLLFWNTGNFTANQMGNLLTLGTNVETAEGKVKALNEAIEAERERIKALAQAQREAVGVAGMTDEQWEAITERMQALGDAFAETYGNYKELYDGVFGTFDEVGDITETTTGKMLEALQGQIDYWGRYSDNLEKIRSFADDNGIDLTAIWGDLSSGSQTAMGYTNAIVKDLESLPELVTKLTENQEVRDKLAEWQALNDQAVTDELENLKDEIAGIVEETKAPDEAYSAMKATLQGYIDALEDETVTDAIRRAGVNWRLAVKFAMPEVLTNNRADPYDGMPYKGYRAYARGTGNARRGWAIVGEEGPELAWFNGGERVLPAEDTARVLAYDDTGRQSTEVHIHIPAGATAETIREARAYGEDVEKIVKRVLRDERVDTRRRSYT